MLNGKKVFNHVARTNVSDKFWGRKHKVNQHDICDYLKNGDLKVAGLQKE